MSYFIEEDFLDINYTPGRKGYKPLAIVIHVVEGSMDAMDSWFKSEQSKVSAHFGNSYEGKLKQYVRLQDTAWANGRIARPKAKLVLENPGINPNYYTVSIEHEGSGKQDLTEKQRNASAWLINKLCKELFIPLDRRHILRHNEIFADKTCPGAIDVDRLLAVAKAQQITQQREPQVVYSGYFEDYLIVTKVRSDTDWEFIPFKQLQTLTGLKAQTPLSQMPHSRKP